MRVLLFAALVLAATAAPAQLQAQLSADTTAKIDAAANKILAETGVPSASLGIVAEGKIVYAHAYGLARVSPPLPATPDLAYPIGSISKQFTSTAVLLLQEQGKLSIDDPVAKYFPELTRAADVKLRNLMTMTSGYEDFAPQDYSIPLWYQPREPIVTVREWAGKPLDFEPGTQWQYSNTNYVLLALIVEKVTGEPFYKYLREHVLDAAHLSGAFVAYADRDKLKTTGYVSYAMQPPRVLPLEASGWYFGDGELAMPAATLLKWDLTFIDQSILTPASYKQMETPFILKDSKTGKPDAGKDTNYGLGIFVRERNGHRMIEHGGEVGGYVAENVVYPEDKMAIVVLTNEVASDAASGIAAAVHALLVPSAAAPASAPDSLAAQMPAILAGFAKGEIDRSLFTSNCNSYFSKDALADFKATLAPLGAVTSVKRTRTSLRGGMTFGLWSVTFAGGTTLTMDTYTLPDGKIEQFLILSKA
ncbi:MAG: serine hydrolase domain-containing protein [Acidobacteriaceae bacterium]